MVETAVKCRRVISESLNLGIFHIHTGEGGPRDCWHGLESTQEGYPKSDDSNSRRGILEILTSFGAGKMLNKVPPTEAEGAEFA